MFLCKELSLCCWPRRNCRSEWVSAMGLLGKKRMEPDSRRSHHSRCWAGDAEAVSVMVTSDMVSACGEFAAQPDGEERGEADDQHKDARGQRDEFVAGIEGDVMAAGAVVDPQTEDAQECNAEEG